LDMEMPGGLPEGSAMAGIMKTYFGTQKKAQAPPAPPSNDAIAGMLGGNMPEEPAPHVDFSAFPRDSVPGDMADALQKGLVTEATITAAAGRVLLQMERFGYLDGQQKHDVTGHATEENARVIEKTAEDAAVLLKNDGGVLPLKSEELSSVALIGPGAGQVVAIGTSGERSEGLPEREIGPLEAMEKVSDAKIAYAVADDMTGVPIPAASFSHEGKSGLERIGVDGKTAGEDAEINFTNTNGRALAANSKVSWKGQLSIPKAGSYWMYLQLMGAYGSLRIDGKMVARSGVSKGSVHGDIVQANHDNVLPTTDGLDNVRRAVELTAGAHDIEVAISGDSTNDVEQVRLNWQTPEQRAANHDAAIAAAKKAKKAIVFVWTRGKPDFALPGDQDKLIDEISAVNRNTVVVLNVSQPVALPWLGKVKGVLQMWWPGDEGGWATANILLGKTSPAGRLPFTWAKKLQDYPATDPAHPERSGKGVDGKTTYSEGVNIGYRWFDEKKIAPLFPFGFGLSYTKFEYSNLHAAKASDGGLDVHLTLKNSGAMAGDEVPQVYLGRPENLPAGVQSSVWTLAGFEHVQLDSGATKDVAIHVPLRRLQYWSADKGEWATPQGSRKLAVGASSRDLRLEGNTD
jgi:beta-glucosidase